MSISSSIRESAKKQPELIIGGFEALNERIYLRGLLRYYFDIVTSMQDIADEMSQNSDDDLITLYRMKTELYRYHSKQINFLTGPTDDKFLYLWRIMPKDIFNLIIAFFRELPNKTCLCIMDNVRTQIKSRYRRCLQYRCISHDEEILDIDDTDITTEPAPLITKVQNDLSVQYFLLDSITIKIGRTWRQTYAFED